MRVGAAGAGLKPWPGGYRWLARVSVSATQRPWPRVGRPRLAAAWLQLLHARHTRVACRCVVR